MEYEIKRMQEGDLAQVVNIEKISFSPPWPADDFRARLFDPKSYYLSAKQGEKVLGYVGYESVLDEGHIARLAVQPDFRERGIARALVNAILLRAKVLNAKSVFLEVRQSNLPPQNLYKSLGFKEIARRKKYYDGGEDAIVLKLDLEDGGKK